MTDYLRFEEIARFVGCQKMTYARQVFSSVERKLTLREFAIVLRAMERGFTVKRIVEILNATQPR